VTADDATDPEPTPEPTVEPTPGPDAVPEDVPGDPVDIGSPPEAGDPDWSGKVAPPPPDPDCHARGCMMDVARYEIGNRDHNRERDHDNCNFYSGALRTGSASTSGCHSYLGTQWRWVNWCADFSRWIWKNNGSSISGIDAWAGSFYRANKSNGHYHRKGTYTPQPGDAVLFDWDGGTASLGNDGWDIDHVGLFEKFKNGQIVTIDGNTGGGASREGVFRKTRSTARVVGYVTPRF
jgi:hypothetical protein